MAASCPHCSASYPSAADHCPSCGAAPDGYAFDNQPDSPRPSLAQELLDRLREATAGEFEVLEEIGHGGMARVYLAHEIVLERLVALKVLSPLFSEYPEIIRRFQHEARTAGQLSHPNIVPVFAVYQRSGLSFFSMPHVPGISLRTLLREQGQLSVDEAIGYVLQAAAGLAYAHDSGVVHRDVKPENMMLEEPHGRLVLTDFGLAKALGGEALTVPGDMIGTPHYMSPEQCEGREVDGRSDQYSLALVAYELLSGQHPYGELGFRQLMMKQMNEDPPPLREVRADLPRGVSEAIKRALSKDVSRRFPSIYSFAGALAGAEAEGIPSRGSPGESRLITPLSSSSPAIETQTVWMRESVRRAHRRRHSIIRLARVGRSGVLKLRRLNRRLARVSSTPDGKLLVASAAAVLVALLAGVAASGRSAATALGKVGPDGEAASVALLTFNDLATTDASVGAILGPPRGLQPAAVDSLTDSESERETDGGSPPARSADRVSNSSPVARRANRPTRPTRRGSGTADQPAAARGSTAAAGQAGRGGSPDSGRGPTDEAALETLLDVYRRALEREDFDALRRNVYAGDIPGADRRKLSMIFDSADQLSVELDVPEIRIDGDRIKLEVLHRIDFQLAKTGRADRFQKKLTMTFERGPAGWHLVQLK